MFELVFAPSGPYRPAADCHSYCCTFLELLACLHHRSPLLRPWLALQQKKETRFGSSARNGEHGGSKEHRFGALFRLFQD